MSRIDGEGTRSESVCRKCYEYKRRFIKPVEMFLHDFRFTSEGIAVKHFDGWWTLLCCSDDACPFQLEHLMSENTDAKQTSLQKVLE